MRRWWVFLYSWEVFPGYCGSHRVEYCSGRLRGRHALLQTETHLNLQWQLHPQCPTAIKTRIGPQLHQVRLERGFLVLWVSFGVRGCHWSNWCGVDFHLGHMMADGLYLQIHPLLFQLWLLLAIVCSRTFKGHLHVILLDSFAREISQAILHFHHSISMRLLYFSSFFYRPASNCFFFYCLQKVVRFEFTLTLAWLWLCCYRIQPRNHPANHLKSFFLVGNWGK